MKTIEDFEPFVLAYAPFIPQEILQHAIRETIVEFMRESRCASDTLDVETQEKVGDYMLEVPDCRRIVKVTSVMETPLRCSGRENWNPLVQGEEADYTIELRRGEHPIIVLNNPRNKPTKLRVDYVWAIGRDDCDVPDFIYDDYMQAILYGTLVRLAMLPEQDALLRQVTLFQTNWFNALQQAKIDKTGGKARRIIGASFLGRSGRGRLWL